MVKLDGVRLLKGLLALLTRYNCYKHNWPDDALSLESVNLDWLRIMLTNEINAINYSFELFSFDPIFGM